MEKNGKKSVLGAFANIFTEKDKHGGKEPIDTDEYLSELARSAEEYHSDSTDARGVAAKKGFARSGESDEDGYEVFRTREGVPKPPEGLIFLYRTDEEGEYMTIDKLMNLTIDPGDHETWPVYERTVVCWTLDEHGTIAYSKCGGDLKELIKAQIERERIFARKYAEYVKANPNAERDEDDESCIETVYDLSTKQIREIVQGSNGKYTAASLKYLPPEKLRELVRNCRKKPIQNNEANKEVNKTSTVADTDITEDEELLAFAEDLLASADRKTRDTASLFTPEQAESFLTAMQDFYVVNLTPPAEQLEHIVQTIFTNKWSKNSEDESGNAQDSDGQNGGSGSDS